jgi:hypothetical protein
MHSMETPVDFVTSSATGAWLRLLIRSIRDARVGDGGVHVNCGANRADKSRAFDGSECRTILGGRTYEADGASNSNRSRAVYRRCPGEEADLGRRVFRLPALRVLAGRTTIERLWALADRSKSRRARMAACPVAGTEGGGLDGSIIGWRRSASCVCQERDQCIGRDVRHHGRQSVRDDRPREARGSLENKPSAVQNHAAEGKLKAS